MSEEPKSYTLAEVAKHNTRESCWLALFGKVYDVTEFLEEHPGGDDIVIENAGTDATEEFEDIGHSSVARDMLEKYEIGVCPEKSVKAEARKQEEAAFVQKREGVSWIRILLPFLLVAAAVLYSYFNQSNK